MALPAYWWLLALVVVVQGCYFLRISILRMRGKGVQPLARLTWAAVAVSAAAGLAYGTVQRDPLFVVGQSCLLVFYYRRYREEHVQREE